MFTDRREAGLSNKYCCGVPPGCGTPTFRVDPLLPVLLGIELVLFCTVLNVLAFFAEISSQSGLIKAGTKDQGFDLHSSRVWDVHPVIDRHYGLVSRRYAYLRPIRAFLHPDTSPVRAMAIKR